ncbi:MAG TPA: PA2169 family four-helix-bundle protein [Stellaceae bacterium]|nr:PA2169 family four-helix-bundle protein [Stellaceae bacterium]
MISTLNDLIETSKDGEQGFRTCADGVKDAKLKSLFEEVARRCAEGAAELNAKVRGLGGDPEKSGSLHRGWVNIKSTITGMDEAAVLAECERGEDSAQHTYEDALKKELPADIRSMVERQYQVVRQNHDRVRNLRDMART